jgi:hypothetical protein
MSENKTESRKSLEVKTRIKAGEGAPKNHNETPVRSLRKRLRSEFKAGPGTPPIGPIGPGPGPIC